MNILYRPYRYKKLSFLQFDPSLFSFLPGLNLSEYATAQFDVICTNNEFDLVLLIRRVIS